jgi:hypothetical protein
MKTYETFATVEDQGQVRVAGVPFEPGTAVEVTINSTRDGGNAAATAASDRAAEAANDEDLHEMDDSLIHDRGRGPEIVGTRITVLDLLPYFLDPSATEVCICRVNNLSADQVAAARAYVLHHPDTVLAAHLEIEARMAAGNPPGVVDKAKRTHDAFMAFRQWLAERGQACSDSTHSTSSAVVNGLPAFREWLAEREAHAGERS